MKMSGFRGGKNRVRLLIRYWRKDESHHTANVWTSLPAEDATSDRLSEACVSRVIPFRPDQR